MQHSLSIWIGNIEVKNLRCHQHRQWSLKSGVNIFIGENGCGKTSVLEAVYMMVYGRSFRQARDPELVRWQASHLHIHGTWHRYGPLHVQVYGQRRKTELRLQGRKLTQRKELTDTLAVLVDAPQGKKLIDGVNQERRKWLDRLLMFCEPIMQQHYQAYLRALMQRSRVLRKHGHNDELSAWEAQMVLHGRPIQQQRDKLCVLMNSFLAKEEGLTEYRLRLELSSHVPDQDSTWIDLLEEKREQDKRMGRCQSGPHSDKLHIKFPDKDIRAIGSRGQQKLAAIAMKLAECGVVEQYRHIWSVLLLDDCFEALDQKRRSALIKRLCQYSGQVLATAPNHMDMPSDVMVWQMHEDADKLMNHSMVSHEVMEKVA